MFFNFALHKNFRPNSILPFQVTQSLHNWICRQVLTYEESKRPRGCQGRYIALIRRRQTAYRKLSKNGLVIYRCMHVCLALVVEDVTAWLECKMSIPRKRGRWKWHNLLPQSGQTSWLNRNRLRNKSRMLGFLAALVAFCAQDQCIQDLANTNKQTN